MRSAGHERIQDAPRSATNAPSGVPRLLTSIGSIPVPLAMGASMIPALGLGDGGEREPSMDRLSVPRLIELADGRQLWIEDVEVASDELGLRFRTLR